MEDIPLSWEIAGFIGLVLISAFFSIAETAMMAFNRYRLKHMVAQGDRSALRVTELLKRTDRLLGGILMGNTLSITFAASVGGLIAVRLFGEDRLGYFLHPPIPPF